MRNRCILDGFKVQSLGNIKREYATIAKLSGLDVQVIDDATNV